MCERIRRLSVPRPRTRAALALTALVGVSALVGPLLAFGNLQLGYTLLKALQALVMSLTAVPVFLWARSPVPPRYALLALAVPGLAFAGFVMTEVAFYPMLCLAAWAMARALERPTAGRQALALAGIGVATLTRLQAIALVPALVLAILIKAALDRTWLRGLRRFAPLVGALVGLAAVGVAVKLA